MGDMSFLLTPDIMWEAEFELVTRRADLNSTVLKVAHHGSDTSTTREFLAVVGPQIAVISVGKDSPFGHPTEEVMDRLKAELGAERIYRTDEHGTIEIHYRWREALGKGGEVNHPNLLTAPAL
jgi:competence protein ComEC